MQLFVPVFVLILVFVFVFGEGEWGKEEVLQLEGGGSMYALVLEKAVFVFVFYFVLLY